MKKEEKWFAVEITAQAEAADAIEFALGEFAALGTEINQLGKKNEPEITVIGYFNELPDERCAARKIRRRA